MRNRHGLETKAADENEDLQDALSDLEERVEAKTEKKVSKLIADALKPLDESLINIEKKMNRPSGVVPIEGKGDVLVIDPAVAAIESKSIGAFLRSPMKQFDTAALLSKDEQKAMSVGSDPDGGYLVFPVLSSRVNKRLFAQSAMRRIADVQTITSGDAWEEPIDFDDVGATWVSENEARPETSTAQVGVIRIDLHELYAMPKVSQKMLDTASWDVAGWLEGKLGDKFGRSEGVSFITGDGIKKPRGLLTYPAGTPSAPSPLKIVRIASGSATGLTPDGLKNMVWALPAPYRAGARWLMSTNAAAQIDLFKDSNGQFIWRDGLTSGGIPTLLGYPVEIDDNMPNVGAGAEPVAFGNWKIAYTIVDRPGYKLLQDPYTSKPHVLFYTYKRVGGGLRNGDAVRIQTISA